MDQKTPVVTIILGTLAILIPCILAYGLTMPDVANGQVVNPGLPWNKAIWIVAASLPGMIWIAYRTRSSSRGARVAGITFIIFWIFFLVFTFGLVSDQSPDDPAIQVVAAVAGLFMLFGLAFLVLRRRSLSSFNTITSKTAEVQPPTVEPASLGQPIRVAEAKEVIAASDILEDNEVASREKPNQSGKELGFPGRIAVFSATTLVAAGVSSIPSIPGADKYKVLLGLALMGLVAAGLVPSTVLSEFARVFAKKD